MLKLASVHCGEREQRIRDSINRKTRHPVAGVFWRLASSEDINTPISSAAMAAMAAKR